MSYENRILLKCPLSAGTAMSPLHVAFGTREVGSTGTAVPLNRRVVSVHYTGTRREDPWTPVQYKRATLRKLRSALYRARRKLTASQKRYKDGFDKKVCYHPVVGAGDFVHVDRPPHR